MGESKVENKVQKRLRVIKSVSTANTQRPAAPLPARSAPLARRSLRRQLVDQALAQLTGTALDTDTYNILVLNYTMRCPLACDYCCYGCSPARNETMNVELALDLVDQAAELGVFAQCAFTGGEALIFRDEVMRITARMHQHGLPFSMISSCFWAKTPAEAASVIGDLADHGLCEFTATHDDSHENWVPVEWIRNAVEAALARDVRVVLTSSFYDDKKRLETIFPEYVGRPNVDYVNRVVLPNVGRSARKSITPASYPGADTRSDGACYKRIYHDVTVFWDGEVYPCCSIYNRATPQISLGNAYRDSLATIWERAEGSLWLRTIKRGGFAALYELIQQSDPALAADLPDPKAHIGVCDLCHSVFKNQALADRVFAVMEQHERTRIRDMLAAVRAVDERAGSALIESVLKEANV